MWLWEVGYENKTGKHVSGGSERESGVVESL